jgi:hypothetical protein
MIENTESRTVYSDAADAGDYAVNHLHGLVQAMDCLLSDHPKLQGPDHPNTTGIFATLDCVRIKQRELETAREAERTAALGKSKLPQPVEVT